MNTPATLDLSLVPPTNSTGTLNTWQLWIEALAPSTSAGDIVFTLTGDSSGLPASDIVRATAVEANLVAHRTGGRRGEAVSEDLESAGDPNTYMILTNRDFEQGLPLAGRDFDDAIALLPPFIGPAGQADDDLAKITLKRLPSGLNAGSVRLSVSHPDAVRLFKAVPGSVYGTALSPGEWTASLSGSGYLADLKSRDVDIWLEGLKKVGDFKFTMEYVAPSGLKTSDDVHMLIADWTFRGSDGYEVPFVSPVWLDAILAATDSPKKPLADPTGAFYKIHIDGLAPRLVTQLLVASDSTTDFYTESYAGGDFDTAYSNATVSRRFGVLHSAEHVLYAPEAPAVTPDDQRERIRDTLDLNVVHNDGLEATVVTPWDTQSEYLRKHGRFRWSLQENGTSVYAVGDTIKGSIEWPERFFPKTRNALGSPISPRLFATTDEQNPQFTPLKWSHDGQTLDFEFAARREGYLRIVFCQQPETLVPIPYWTLSSILVRITANGELPKWEAKAWDALKVDGFVPGDPINRNRQINTRYAEMYNSGISQDRPNPYGWFGIAAFVSTGAGVGMTTAMNLDAAPDAAGVDSRKVVDGLADGNLTIFIDVYKQALAYNRSSDGLKELDRMLKARELRSERQLEAWKAIHLGVFGDPAENILPDQEKVDAGVRLLVQVEQDTTLQEVLNKDLPLWKAATDNLGTWIERNAARIGWQWRLFLMTTPIPGNYSSFQAYRSEDPTVPDDASFSEVNARLAWFDAKLLPAWKVWRAANPGEIVVSRLLRGGYHQ